ESAGPGGPHGDAAARRRGDRVMRRREFIALLGGAAAASSCLWPRAARTQQSERVRRIGVLMSFAADDATGQTRIAAFVQGLQQSGWTEHNVRIEIRWGAGDPQRYRRYAAELVALKPDVILAGGGSVVPSLLQATRTVPIVFAQVVEPAAAGYRRYSSARPGGNATGFSAFEFALSAKWL